MSAPLQTDMRAYYENTDGERPAAFRTDFAEQRIAIATPPFAQLTLSQTETRLLTNHRFFRKNSLAIAFTSRTNRLPRAAAGVFA